MSTQDAINQLTVLKEQFNKFSEKDEFHTDPNIITLSAERIERIILEYYTTRRPDIGQSFIKALNRIKKQRYNNLTKLGDLRNVLNDALLNLNIRLNSKPEEEVTTSNGVNQIPADLQQAILMVIYDNGLTKDDFERGLSFGGKRNVYAFTYRTTQMSFSFVQSNSDYDKFFVWFNWCTPDYKLDKREREYLNTEQALSFFDDWIKGHLTDYKKKFESPDPWSLILDESSTGNRFQDTEEQFTTKDKDYIKERLDVLEKVLADQFDLQEEEIATLKQAVAAMKAQLEKLDKPIWKRVAKTIVIDTVKDIAKNPDEQHSIIEKIRDTFEGAKDIVAGFLN